MRLWSKFGPWLLLAAVLSCAGWAVSDLWGQVVAAGAGMGPALWTLPWLIGLHGVQLLLSALAWGWLIVPRSVGLGALFLLRLVREGVNSLLPVAHVGGEVVAAGLLGRRGVPVPRAAASVIVDVTMEVCSQVAFLAAGMLALGWVTGATPLWLWLGSVGSAALVAGGLVLGQRLGLLRLLERLAQAIGARFPGMATGALGGLAAESQAIYARRGPLGASFGLQAVAWALGAGETWLVFQALGVDASPAQAFAVESLGAAARSAGFAVPGALAVQETGFVLAAAAAGLPEFPALTLSLVKRIREVVIGLAGLALWRVLGRRPPARA